MRKVHRCLKMRMVRKVVIGAAVFPLAVSVSFSADKYCECERFVHLTLTQARNMTACLPRSTIDPNAARVCFSGRMWVNSLPSYAQSSNQRFDFLRDRSENHGGG